MQTVILQRVHLDLGSFRSQSLGSAPAGGSTTVLRKESAQAGHQAQPARMARVSMPPVEVPASQHGDPFRSPRAAPQRARAREAKTTGEEAGQAAAHGHPRHTCKQQTIRRWENLVCCGAYLRRRKAKGFQLVLGKLEVPRGHPILEYCSLPGGNFFVN